MKRKCVPHCWDEAYRENTGLLLFGDAGTGKSFFAGCIANALPDRDIPVLMTNFPTILNRLTGMFDQDRADFIASLGIGVPHFIDEPIEPYPHLFGIPRLDRPLISCYNNAVINNTVIDNGIIYDRRTRIWR